MKADAVNPDAVVRPLPGAGLVVRAGDMLMICADQGDGADELLALFSQSVAGGADGSALVRRVAALLAGDETGRYPACAISGPATDGRTAVLVYGDATAGVMGPDGPLVLSGADAITSLDRLVPGPVTRIRLELPGAGTADPRVRLESGVVFGAGVVVEAAGSAADTSVGSAAPVGSAAGGAAVDLELPPRPQVSSPPVDRELPPKQQGFGAAAEAVGSAPSAQESIGSAPQESVGSAPPAEEAVGSAPDKGSPAEDEGSKGGDTPWTPSDWTPSDSEPPVAKPFTMEPPEEPPPQDPSHAADAASDYEKPPPPPPPLPVSEQIGEAPPESVAADAFPQQPAGGAPVAVGIMVLDDGSTFRLDIDYVIGREPQHDPDVVSGAARAIKIEDAEGVVSRKHLRVAVAGSELRLIDLGSSNGTFVQLPGDPQRLQLVAGQPAPVPPGTLVTMGRRWLRFDPDPAT